MDFGADRTCLATCLWKKTLQTMKGSTKLWRLTKTSVLPTPRQWSAVVTQSPPPLVEVAMEATTTKASEQSIKPCSYERDPQGFSLSTNQSFLH